MKAKSNAIFPTWSTWYHACIAALLIPTLSSWSLAQSLREGGTPHSANNYAIENLIGVGGSFPVRIIVKNSEKMGGALLEAEIAGQRTMISYRPDLTVKMTGRLAALRDPRRCQNQPAALDASMERTVQQGVATRQSPARAMNPFGIMKRKQA